MRSFCEQSWWLVPFFVVGGLLLLASVPLFIDYIDSDRRGRAIVKVGGVDIDAPAFVVLALLGLVMLLAPIIALKHCQSPAAPDVSVVENHYNTISEVREEFNRDYKTDGFWLRRQPRGDMVYGDSGIYYYIDLRDRRADSFIYFDAGKYTPDELSAAFQEALDSMKARVLHPLDTLKVPYKLYVVGSADTMDAADPLLGTVLDDLPPQITFLKRNPRNTNQWLRERLEVPTPRDYANDDLPNLRGAYLQQFVQAMGYQAMLLEGRVVESLNEKDRHARLLLFWPDDDGTRGTPTDRQPVSP